MQTSKTSTRQLTLDELISSPAGSPASHTATPANGEASTTPATCGRRCLELSESVLRVGSWARTFSGFLLGRTGFASRRCALAWKLKGTRYNRLYFQLQGSEPHTAGLESGLLLTRLAVQVDEPPERYKARHALRTQMGKNNPNDPPGNKYNCLLSQLLYGGMLPTVTATTHKGGTDKARTDGRERTDEIKHLVSLATGKPSQLSPLFAGEMMGYPNDWTVSPFQSGSAKP